MGSDMDMTDEGLYFSNAKRKPNIQYLEDEDEMEVLSVQQQMKKMKLPSNEYDSAEDDLLEVEYDQDMDLQDFKIVVKTLSGQSIDIKVNPMFTIQQLKDRMEECQGIPSDQQRLIFNGKTMAESRHLWEYKITEGCIIHLILALRGG